MNNGNSSVDLFQAEGEEDSRAEEEHMDAVYKEMVNDTKKANTLEQVKAILHTVERENQEVIDTLGREDGDLDNIIDKVRTRKRETHA